MLLRYDARSLGVSYVACPERRHKSMDASRCGRWMAFEACLGLKLGLERRANRSLGTSSSGLEGRSNISAVLSHIHILLHTLPSFALASSREVKTPLYLVLEVLNVTCKGNCTAFLNPIPIRPYSCGPSPMHPSFRYHYPLFPPPAGNKSLEHQC